MAIIMREWKSNGAASLAQMSHGEVLFFLPRLSLVHIKAYQYLTDVMQIFRVANSMSVNDEVLEKLQESYAVEMISLTGKPSSKDADDHHSTNWLERYCYQILSLFIVIVEIRSYGLRFTHICRYGEKLSDDVAVDIQKVGEDLRDMEHQVQMHLNYPSQ
jgi:hypothetical protein